MLKRIICFCLIALTLALPVAAAECDYSYTYNSEYESVPVPSPYYVKTIFGTELSLNTPKDVIVHNNEIYILDSGNNRIVVLDEQYNLIKEIKLKNTDGSDFAVGQLEDIFIAHNSMYIVDRSNECIIKADMSGNVSRTYTAPKEADGQTEKSFVPLECVVDGAGYLYILLENEYRGLMVLDTEGNYSTYYGSVNVTVNSQVLKTAFWRTFMTEEQIEGTSQYVPGGYNSVTINNDGFIYAVRGVSSSSEELVCKLNPSGNNVLTYTGDFGDSPKERDESTLFSSIAVDKNGFIATIDSTTDKIFRYTPDGYLMYAFGGTGEASGLFSEPSSIAYNGTDLIVTDSHTSTVTVFSPEQFTLLVDEAEQLYRAARFKDAESIWKEVLAIDSNYELALVGMGKVAEAEKDYITAMDYYRRGGSKPDYSSAFTKQRSILINKYFSYFAVVAIIGIAAYLIIKKKRIAKYGIRKVDYEHGTRLQYLRFAVFHPFDGFGEFRYNHKESPVIALSITAILFFVSCLNYNYDGFVFNADNPENFNMFIVLGSTVGVALMFVLCEWLLATFFDGKGTLSQILCGVCYSLVPMIIGRVLELILSNVLSIDEIFFVSAINVITTVWSLALVFIAMKEINQYSFTKNIISIFVTILGVLAVVFLIVLFFNLLAQLISFISAVVTEISCRISAI